MKIRDTVDDSHSLIFTDLVKELLGQRPSVYNLQRSGTDIVQA